MKSILVSLSFAILSLIACASCKKSDNVTPIDPIPGEYQMTGVTSYTIDGIASSSPTTGSLSVYAGNAPGTYYFMERYSTTELGYLTTHNSGTFTVERVPDFSVYNQVKYYGFQSGGGSTAANKIMLDRVADTNNSTYIAPTGSSYTYNKSIRKRVTMTATK